MCWHHAIFYAGEQIDSFLIVPKTTPLYATIPQGFQFIWHWLLQ